mmetsp:Transcript_5150/g.11682  ORF Transcript_5150/g.11682 Transcript_5150/m.11682 type:complete len:185 (+) Transcript_5150:40-594(+)
MLCKRVVRSGVTPEAAAFAPYKWCTAKKRSGSSGVGPPPKMTQRTGVTPAAATILHHSRQPRGPTHPRYFPADLAFRHYFPADFTRLIPTPIRSPITPPIEQHSATTAAADPPRSFCRAATRELAVHSPRFATQSHPPRYKLPRADSAPPHSPSKIDPGPQGEAIPPPYHYLVFKATKNKSKIK